MREKQKEASMQVSVLASFTPMASIGVEGWNIATVSL
jgi:hypothetical protein